MDAGNRPSPEKYPCPCCGYYTLLNEPPGTYELCPICFWEDDGVQYRDPDAEGGANRESLRQAQRNFQEFGAISKREISAVRKPTPEDKRKRDWKPL